MNGIRRLFSEPIQRPENPIKLVLLLNARHWLVFLAAFLGWTLDAMDYHAFNLAVGNMAKDFAVANSVITNGITLALLLRPVGALIFGLLGDRYGRRGPLMVDIFLFSFLEAMTGFSGNLAVLFFLRCLFGICLGGEWGLGAALALEELPVEARGLFAGLLQQGYATGNLLASGLSAIILPKYGWRALFWICSFPAVLILFIRFFVPESPAIQAQIEKRENKKVSFLSDITASIKKHWILFVYCVVLMTGFNFFSHGSQDLYPTFIGSLGYSDAQKSVTNAISATGAICGGTIIGFFGQYLGRRRAMILSILGAAAMIYPWAYSTNLSTLQVSGFFMQFFVQGAWGVIPAHLNELSPPSLRATFPGLTYNLGNMISAASATIESSLGERYPTVKNGVTIPNYAITQALLMGIVTCCLVVIVAVGDEKKGRDLTVAEEPEDATASNSIDAITASTFTEAKVEGPQA
ncbi:sugar transporter family protein [Chytriomyces sp. MP71]|nr:sugar transporter family protein [Chytriomyces sp. MP71]